MGPWAQRVRRSSPAGASMVIGTRRLRSPGDISAAEPATTQLRPFKRAGLKQPDEAPVLTSSARLVPRAQVGETAQGWSVDIANSPPPGGSENCSYTLSSRVEIDRGCLRARAWLLCLSRTCFLILGP